jgi:hypothetical protein
VTSRILFEESQMFNTDIRMSLKGNASKDPLEEFYYDLETENLIRKK